MLHRRNARDFFPSWFWYKIKSWDACCINIMLAICFRALFYIKLRVVARICFSITCYIDGMLAIFFRAFFYIKLRVAARICFSITCYIDGMLAIFFPSWFWYKIKSWDACCINRMPAIFFPGTFLYKIKSGRAHLFFYNMLHRRNAREFFSELILK